MVCTALLGGCTEKETELRPSLSLLATTMFLPWESSPVFLVFCLTCFASKVVILETLNQIKLLF